MINKYQHGSFLKNPIKYYKGVVAKKLLTRKKNPNWDELDKGYKYLIGRGMDHNTAIAVLANVVQESGGNPNARQYPKGRGRGLLQWNDQAPQDQWGFIHDSIYGPANVYNKETKVSDNYWKTTNRSGKEIQESLRKPGGDIEQKTRDYSESYIRPGKPDMQNRLQFARYLNDIYYMKQGGAFVKNVNVLDSNPNRKKKKLVKRSGQRAETDLLKQRFDEGGSINWGNTIKSAFNTFNGFYQANKYNDAQMKAINTNYKLMSNTVDDNQINSETEEQLGLLQQQNPNQNFGEIDRQQIRQQIKNKYLQQAKLRANKWKEEQLAELSKENQEINKKNQDNLFSMFGDLTDLIKPSSSTGSTTTPSSTFTSNLTNPFTSSSTNQTFNTDFSNFGLNKTLGSMGGYNINNGDYVKLFNV